jgi:hypothetical protein
MSITHLQNLHSFKIQYIPFNLTQYTCYIRNNFINRLLKSICAFYKSL